MKILVLADEESRYLWDYYTPGKLDGIDLILSAGDLKPEYLSFIATFAHCPVLYVHGNHDDRYEQKPPLGCICIEDTIYEYQGLRILGLGGSIKYRSGQHMYTQRQMRHRIRKLWWKLYRKKGFDILLAHSPGEGMVECEDYAHQGFSAFNELLQKYTPKLFIHGHTHLTYGKNIERESTFGETRVVNGYERYVFEI